MNPSHAPSEPDGPSDDREAALRAVRNAAEHRVRIHLTQPLPAIDPDSAARLAHELGVHQVELEIQNEHLRLTQASLESTRDRYMKLYEQAPVGYVTLSLSGLISNINERARQLLQLAAPQSSSRRLVELIAFEDRPRFQQHMTRLLRGDGPQQLKVTLTGPAGEPRLLALGLSLMQDAEEGPQCLLALTDITEHVRMQQRVARLAAIVASSDDAIVSRDLDGRVISWNDAAAQLFGCSAQVMLGEPMDRLVPHDLKEEEAGLLARLREGGRVRHFETVRRTAADAAVPLSISLSPILDDGGQIVGSAMIARDITAQRRAEQQLRHRLRQLDVLSEAGQALILGDATTRRSLFQRVATAVGCEMHLVYAVFASGEAASASGEAGSPPALVLEYAVGATAEQHAALAAPDAVEALCRIAVEQRRPQVIDATHGPAALSCLERAGARSAAVFPLSLYGAVHSVVVFVSTTRSIWSADDLQVMRTVCDQVSAMLERTRLIEELHDNENSLRRADKAKDDFIATLAHELRNPLAPIRNAVELMRHVERISEQQLVWCRDIIERQVTQMTHLMDDLLDVSRVTRNKIELRCERLDVMQAVEQALEATRPLIEKRQQRLEVEPPAEPVALYGDLTRLTQVFSNLLNNAAKYTDVGGLITVSVRPTDSHVRIRVRDTGIGIAAEELARVFDMFAQFAPPLERAGGGLGIGLALTRGLVQLHGGTIEVHSAGAGRGSEFVVCLPRRRDWATSARGALPLPAEQLSGSPQRLLVLDDNADAAQTLGVLLELLGHEVRTVSSGQEALRVVEQWDPQVVVLDIGLPDLSGYDVCRAIRGAPGGRQRLLITCTGWGQREDVERARTAGFDFHLVKPVDPSAVVDLIRHRREVGPSR